MWLASTTLTGLAKPSTVTLATFICSRELNLLTPGRQGLQTGEGEVCSRMRGRMGRLNGWMDGQMES